jgi:hypothetical protein
MSALSSPLADPAPEMMAPETCAKSLSAGQSRR